MIVCHCKVVSDGDIRAALDEGARSVSAVCRATDAGRDCGVCVFSVKAVVCQHHARRNASQSLEVDGAAS